MKVSAVIAAAGQGRRMDAGINKVYLELFGKSVLEHTVSVFEKCEKRKRVKRLYNFITKWKKVGKSGKYVLRKL